MLKLSKRELTKPIIYYLTVYFELLVKSLLYCDFGLKIVSFYYKTVIFIIDYKLITLV